MGKSRVEEFEHSYEYGISSMVLILNSKMVNRLSGVPVEWIASKKSMRRLVLVNQACSFGHCRTWPIVSMVDLHLGHREECS
jgi:hypothetical protein